MRTTKNVSIIEEYGFRVMNNYQEVGDFGSLGKAEEKAFEIAKQENKGVRYNTDFYKATISAEKVSNWKY